MNELIAYCGLTCQWCHIYLATREKIEEKKEKMRAEIARLCNEHYGLEFKQEDITDCDGCRTEGGRLFSGCAKCPVRNCGRQKGLENCAYCNAYACDKLKEHFVTDPDARIRLDLIKRSI